MSGQGEDMHMRAIVKMKQCNHIVLFEAGMNKQFQQQVFGVCMKALVRRKHEVVPVKLFDSCRSWVVPV